MNKLARGLFAAIIVAFLVVIIAMIAMAHGRSGTTNKEGALESTLHKIGSSNVHVTALSLSDLYGPEWVAGAMICPGATEQSIAQNYGIDTTDLHLNGGQVPEDVNYIVMASGDGDIRFEQLNRNEIDVCSVGPQGGFETSSLIPFIKQDGVWKIGTGH
ncbi:hypothetical protein [Corynebacterium pseudotuberculosis]|uniref:Uncharacterized protein n=1 Tax=Corynebacterium pseudotuberculosis (strain C231) TaxID=681645 RepID=D9QEI5_CORP2|nr:hypothetical protein [Corynebacterium pseudotuberculosis]ADK28208.1 hypothetical protein CPFRC_02105 [Corynebacterium pseudotuberculosis FRC41]ADL09908.1 hypothetical protein CPC231_02105 [Corynebacterium pseudotuberculosis C231]ADL20314.1 hypothetical protein CP1002_02105 [Corynebacterium pseudotuberculosis 1002]ADO25700.1 hypothetical protein CPI19_02105 [Corynebacterium pseudotuberculosis I19]AEK91750.1 Hypothetical protein CpPAT10_0419 [Corynebacterium pseudotuberculosis PAT10]